MLPAALHTLVRRDQRLHLRELSGEPLPVEQHAAGRQAVFGPAGEPGGVPATTARSDSTTTILFFMVFSASR